MMMYFRRKKLLNNLINNYEKDTDILCGPLKRRCNKDGYNMLYIEKIMELDITYRIKI